MSDELLLGWEPVEALSGCVSGNGTMSGEARGAEGIASRCAAGKR